MSEKNFRSLMESLKDINDADGQHGKKYAYECGACGYTINSDNKLEGNDCPECGGSLSLMKNSPDKKNEDDDNPEDEITEDASKDNSGFTYQDEKGNLYHSDVEIASYRDPETGKIERVFAYGKDGVSKPTKAVPAVVSGMKGESAKLKRLMRENRRLRRGLRESDDVVKVKKVGSIDPYKVSLFQVSGIKDITSYNGIPLYPGLSQGDHDENRFMDTDEIIEWLKTSSDDLRDTDSDEADNVDKLIYKVIDKKDCLYVIVSERYKEVTTDQVLQVVKGDIKLYTSTPDYESAQLRKLMRENRRLRRGLRESKLTKEKADQLASEFNEDDDDPDDNLDEGTSPVTYISGDPKKLNKVDVYPTTLEDKDIAKLFDSSLVKVDDDQDSFELTTGSLKGSFLVPSENLDKEVEVQEGNSDSDLTDVSGKASYYLVTPLVDDDQDVNDLLSDSITHSDDDDDDDNRDKVDD